MKYPSECININEIRQEIDKLDKQIISAISKRNEYVLAATKFKTSEDSVLAKERHNTMVHMRIKWANEFNINPDLIESIYKVLLSYFVNKQMEQWRKQN